MHYALEEGDHHRHHQLRPALLSVAMMHSIPIITASKKGTLISKGTVELRWLQTKEISIYKCLLLSYQGSQETLI